MLIIQDIRNTITEYKYEILLYELMILDFLSTFIGINCLRVITEGNPLMVWLFQLNFIPALTIRLIMVSLIVGLVVYLKKYKHRGYKKVLVVGLVCNIGVMGIHLWWIITYVKAIIK